MGDRIGQYELLGLLGSGGYGTVYRARDTRHGRTVVVRVLGDAKGDLAARARFVESARPCMRISHPGVATVFDVGQHDGYPYVVYEFVPGERLTELSTGKPINPRRALDVCVHAAEGLVEAHALGLVHGGLTPTAIAVTPQGRAKVLDFGLSAWQPGGPGQQTAARLGERGAALGPYAIPYMAPEQVLGRTVDVRADIFSLGVILYQLLTGRQPFEAANATDTAVRVTQHVPPPPSAIAPGVTADLDRIVARAMAKSLTERYESMRAFADDMRTTSQATRHDESGPAERVGEAARPRGRRLLGVLAALVALAVFGTAAWAGRGWFERQWNERSGRQLDPVVAVLPFAVGGGDAARGYIGSGFAEELAARLGHLPGVSVQASGSVRAMGSQPTPTTAAGVDAKVLLAGLIGPGPDGWSRVDVNVELVSGTDGERVWTRHYEAADRDLPTLQASIARDVAARLGRAPSPRQSLDRAALRVVDPAAYDAYLQGLEARAAGDTSRALQQFQLAIDADPSLVQARVGQAEAWYTTAVFEARGSLPSVLDAIVEAGEEASTADPDSAATHLVMGLGAATYLDAVAHLLRAIDANPSDARARLALSDLLVDLDPARAREVARQAAAVDRLQPLALFHEATAAAYTGHPRDALAIVSRGQALSPRAAWWGALRQRALLLGPELEPAVEAPRSVSDFTPATLVRAVGLVRDERHADAAAALEIVTRVDPDLCDARALLAGVTRAGGAYAESARLAGEILDAARTSPDPAGWSRCAALAAAGIQDGAQAAHWLRVAAADARALRLWNATNALWRQWPAIRLAQFPWSGVAADPRFRGAASAMEALVERTRLEVQPMLAGLETPDRSRGVR